MKKIILPAAILTVLSSCGSGNSNSVNEPVHENTINASVIDTTSNESFIQSICNFRKEKEAETPGFEISGTHVLTGQKGFKIFNFNESFDEYNLNTKYVITLNQYEPVTDLQSGKDVFTQLTDLLSQNGLQFALYEGNFEPTPDLRQNGSPDYLLSNERMFRDNYFSSSRIYVYDGINFLSPTMIRATCDYTENENGLSGIKERLEIKEEKKSFPTIFVHHESSISYENSKGGMDETVLKYKQSWQWIPERSKWEPSEWITGLICDYSNCKKLIASLTEKQTLLSSEYEGFAVVEECFKGQPQYFQLVEFENDISSYYVTASTTDDVGSTVVVHVVEDKPSTLILFTARVEKFFANLTGTPELILPLQKYIITNEISEYNQEILAHRHEAEPAIYYYTRKPNEYPFIQCNQTE